ncbi:acyl carrier protein [Streptomyces auratus]|uniref:Acyl carrier protein n=1 Tax=Streptomyces auratus AGR0001 TaxID=1160718 RepID=J2A238_9ACTN|nr:phosphopantetheine-binding protein [Streptomyces auratus]QTZ94644.1 acyl carrier protein [Streptomyces auratus AGR0001]
MERSSVISAVEKSLSAVLERPVTGLTEELRLFEDLHLDSTSVLELLMELEDATEISVDPEDLDMDDFKSVGSLTDYVLSQTAQTTGEG